MVERIAAILDAICVCCQLTRPLASIVLVHLELLCPVTTTVKFRKNDCIENSWRSILKDFLPQGAEGRTFDEVDGPTQQWFRRTVDDLEEDVCILGTQTVALAVRRPPFIV